MKKDYCKRFIPKSCSIQPNEYRVIGLDYAAVFNVPTIREELRHDKSNINAMFYIELVSHKCYSNEWERVEILRQCSDCRKVIYSTTSVKKAIDFLERHVTMLRDEYTAQSI